MIFAQKKSLTVNRNIESNKSALRWNFYYMIINYQKKKKSQGFTPELFTLNWIVNTKNYKDNHSSVPVPRQTPQ